LKLYEYEAKEIARRYNIPVPRGKPVSTPEEAQQVASELGGQVVIKAQVLVGGRGLAGGVKFASTPGEAREVAAKLLSTEIRGLKVSTVLVEEKSVYRENYIYH